MEDAVAGRDVVAVLQPGEMVRRIAEEIEGHLVELGSDGRLIQLQTEELRAGLEATMGLVLRDYTDKPGMDHLRTLSPDALMDLPKVVAALNLPASSDQMHAELAPRGYRMLHRLPQLSETLIDRLVEHSARCPTSCRPRRPNWSRSRGSAPPRPATCGTAWPAWSKRASSSDTSDSRRSGKIEGHVGRG